MFCGIALKTEILNYSVWKSLMPFEIITPINTDNGIIKSRKRLDKSINGKIGQFYETITHTSNFETYKITINEVIRFGKQTKYYLIIRGSLHKNYFKGRNDKRFYIDDVIKEINYLCKKLKIDSKKTKIDSLEFGVNIVLDFKPFNFLREHLINYKSQPFNQYSNDKQNRKLGFVCERTQYLVKCYDKGMQFNLNYNLMRFELKFIKMQRLKHIGILYLNDLIKPEIYHKLNNLLIQCWNNILFAEPLQNVIQPITKLQNTLINKGDNTKYWNELYNRDKRQLSYQRTVYKDLITKFGAGYHKDILTKIKTEWQILSNGDLSNLTIKVISKNVQLSNNNRYNNLKTIQNYT